MNRFMSYTPDNAKQRLTISGCLNSVLAACPDADVRRLAIVPDERNQLANHVLVVLTLHPAPMQRVRSAVAKRIRVVDVDAVEFHAAGINRIGQRGEHTLAFEFPLVAARRREYDGGRTPVSADENAHRATETFRVPAMIRVTHAATV
jgi:hypothetical protein